MPHPIPKILIVVLIQIIIALIHVFRLGQIFSGPWYRLYYGYSSDLILPFGLYFLLSMNETGIPVLRRWYAKAGIIFSLCTLAEIGQFFGYYVLGVTFDPLDIVAYGAGVLVAAFIDVKVFARAFGFWAATKNE